MSDISTETPWRRDKESLTEQLGRWVTAAIAPDATIASLSAPEGNGMSSETVLFDVATAGAVRRFVARLAPMPSLIPVFPEYDLELQRRAMVLAREQAGIPAPEVPYFETDESFLGTPFIVMTRVDGTVPTDVPPYTFGGWVADLSDADKLAFERNAVGVLAKLHTLTPQTADLAFLDRPQYGATPLDQHFGYQRWYYDWAREGVRYPLIERTFEWLEARRPAEGPTVLNWGDSRVGNVLWNGPTPVAVLDWEMAALGPAEIDVAWMIFLHKFFQNMTETYGFPGLPDLLRRDRVAAIYEELTGRPVEALEWYEVFAALRFAIISVRTTTRGIAYGQQAQPDDPDDLIMFRPLLEQMLAGTYWS